MKIYYGNICTLRWHTTCYIFWHISMKSIAEYLGHQQFQTKNKTAHPLQYLIKFSPETLVYFNVKLSNKLINPILPMFNYY